MTSVSKSQKRKNKKKYCNYSKKSRSPGLDSGMKGFLVTCNDERQCLRETLNLLNEFADEIYGSEHEHLICKPEENYIDIEEQFAKEVVAIKSQKRFQQIFTKVKGIIFINTTIPDPLSLVNKIFETVINTEKRRTRFILKLKPVIITCKAYESDIRNSLDDILLQYSAEAKHRELKYKVESKITYNDKITLAHVIWYARESVLSVVPNWSACLLEPDIIISFYILRTICCISILDKYEEYKKYNLSSVATSVENPESNSVKGLQIDPGSGGEDEQTTAIVSKSTGEINTSEKHLQNSGLLCEKPAE